MKKLFGFLMIGITLMCCNTPQPTTTGTGIDTGTVSGTMNQSTSTDTMTAPRDTTMRPADSLQR